MFIIVLLLLITNKRKGKESSIQALKSSAGMAPKGFFYNNLKKKYRIISTVVPHLIVC